MSPLQGEGRRFDPVTRYQLYLKDIMKTYHPLGKRIIFKDTERAEETESGIYLGKNSNDPKAKSGTVIAVGPAVEDVKVGDVVYLQWQKVSAFKDGDIFLGSVHEEDVLAVLE